MAELDLNPDEVTIDRLAKYVEMILFWNSRINLVSKKDADRLVSRHLLDSLTVESMLRGNVVMDIGSGAGLPGIPLASCRPELSFLLVERSAKRSRFLNIVKSELGLDNVECLNLSLSASNESKLICDTAVCRAVHNPITIWSLCKERLSRQGRLVFFLSTKESEELTPYSARLDQLEKINWEVKAVRVPGLSSPHEVLVIDKI